MGLGWIWRDSHVSLIIVPIRGYVLVAPYIEILYYQRTFTEMKARTSSMLMSGTKKTINTILFGVVWTVSCCYFITFSRSHQTIVPLLPTFLLSLLTSAFLLPLPHSSTPLSLSLCATQSPPPSLPAPAGFGQDAGEGGHVSVGGAVAGKEGASEE